MKRIAPEKTEKKEEKTLNKRNKKMREEHLLKIAQLAIENPLAYTNTEGFISLVCKKLKISYHQAKRDIIEIRKRKKEELKLNSKIEISKKNNRVRTHKRKSIKTKKFKRLFRSC